MIPLKTVYDTHKMRVSLKHNFAGACGHRNFVPEITPIPTTMTDKFRKIDKDYILSDSGVNEYGFRLLTDGYQIDSFQRNPIGYYMHRRDDGVALKWEDVRIEGDTVVGKPVINLSNARGQQTCDEVENGFLNAASVGHIVVLEYSTDADMMLPGQTGPTITKWYNKECSLVDIPGNSNALTKLYDEQENELNLIDLNIHIPVMKHAALMLHPELYQLLNLSDDANDQQLMDSVRQLSLQAGMVATLETENNALRSDKDQLQQTLGELQRVQAQQEVTTLLHRALEDKKITVALQQQLAGDYANNAAGLKNLLATMPAYRSIVDSLKSSSETTALQWSWDDFERKDPTGERLKELKANYPDRYQEIFNQKFAAE